MSAKRKQTGDVYTHGPSGCSTNDANKSDNPHNTDRSGYSQESYEYDISSKVNDAKVFLNRFMIDKNTLAQLRDMVLSPALSHIRVMPDCHKGVGCCVGLTSRLTDKIVPRFIGVDIGCGVLTYPIGNMFEEYFKQGESITNLDESSNKTLNESQLMKIDEMIQKVIPLHDVRSSPVVTDDDILKVCSESYDQAYEFTKAHKKYVESNSDTKESNTKSDMYSRIPNYSTEWVKDTCRRVGIEYDYFLKSIGDLGGGNHYCEVNESKTTGEKYITVHSGSRAFGKSVCIYHQSKIDESRKFDYADYKDHMKSVGRKFKNPKDLKASKDKYLDEFHSNKHQDYLSDEEAYDYYFDMIFAQNIAKLNRRVVLREILKAFGKTLHEDHIIESIHNYIDFKDMIIRKGAIRSADDEKCIVSLNMRDGVVICRGKGNPDWNFSAPHGAGRMIERHRVASQVQMHEFIESMKGVYSSCINEDTLDECPSAYKDPNMIMKALAPTADIIEELRPILNIKANN